jgi:hypothetical protein
MSLLSFRRGEALARIHAEYERLGPDVYTMSVSSRTPLT